MKTNCELSTRTAIRAFRANGHVLIVAEGELPTPGFRVDIEQDPREIFPPQFDLLRCRKPGIFPQVITPFRYCETVPFPPDQPQVTVHHAEGSDVVEIEECGKELSGYVRAMGGSGEAPCPEGAEEATGFSKNLSFDEAFADALARLGRMTTPPGTADVLATVRVVEIGGLFGGIAGFHDLFMRVCRTSDG
jgi:hypothetical protein